MAVLKTPKVGSIGHDTGVRATKMQSELMARDDCAMERKHLRILIVEDHPGSQQALRLLLRWLGCHPAVSDNGRDALEAVRRREYDIILMDVMMPRMDGLEATRRIRRDPSLIAQPRIVGMSADTMPEEQETCFAAGMDDFLPKPIDVDRLIRILDEAAVGVSAVC